MNDEHLIKKQSQDFLGNLRNALSDLDDTPNTNPLHKQMQQDPKVQYGDNEFNFDDLDNYIVGSPVKQTNPEVPVYDYSNEYQTPTKTIQKVQFIVKEQAISELKSVTNYSVVIKETGQIIISDIYLKECAVVVRDLLNEGKAISDIKVLGIISAAIQYTTVINEVRKVSSARHAVLREMDYESAKQLDTKLSALHEQALKIKEKSNKFLTENGYQ